jgi:hypothetical protein
MSSLFGNNISQTYQGLIKLADSTTGVTSTTQSLQDGLGNNIPIQVSNNTVNISGSFLVNGQPVSVDTGSLVTKTEFNSYTSSVDLRFDGIEAKTGSYATTGSNVFVGNQTITGSVNVVGSVTATNFTGSLQGTASYATNAATASIANDLIVVGKNNNASTLTKGTIVRIVGANGDNPLFDTASWEDDANSANTLGMLTTDVAPNAFTNIVTQGTVVGINTAGMTAGQMLYLSSSGQYTNVIPPAPYHEVRLGQVLRPQLNNGSAYISVDNGYELGELHDVDITNPVVGDLLVYRSGSYGQWVNETGGEIGLATTGSNTFNGTQTITGSVNVTGTITATSASFTYVNTVYETASVIYSSGSNQLGDASDDVQTLWGDVNLPSGDFSVTGNTLLNGNVDITTGNLNVYSPIARFSGSTVVVTGSVDVTDGITGSLQGTASYATQALSASFASNFDKTGLITTGSAGSTQSITGSVILSGSAGVELDVKGDQTITGSLTVRSGSLSTVSNGTTLNINSYLTSSDAGQSNIIKGWGDNPAPGGPGSLQTNYTGSLRITGSNNTVSLPQLRASANGFGNDVQGYISGSDNIITANNAGIYLNTGSLIFPKTQGNILGNGSFIGMNFTTSSLAGQPLISNNLVLGGGMTLNSNSGSLGTIGQNAILGGAIFSTQNFVTNTRPSITGNNVIGQVILNHISSSINYQQNYNNATISVNNHLSSSITNNLLIVSNNTFLGGVNGGHGIYVSGSQSTNAARGITNNLIGGQSNVVSSSFVSSSISNLNATIIYGSNLTVSGSHVSLGGSAFFGRFNDTGSNLANAQQVVFAVGTGTGAGTRRTGFLIDSGSNVRISGSLIANNTTNALIVTGSSNITHTIAGQPALTLVNSSGTGQPAVSITGSIFATSTGDHTIFGNSLSLSGSVNVRNVMNLTPQNPLPTGVLGDLAVSGSNLFFYNGAWTQIV